MSTYNKEKLINDLNTLCQDYVEQFPDRKIYIAEKLGKRISYLTGSGSELYLKPVEINLNDNFVVFIEAPNKLSPQEKEKLKKLFLPILSNGKQVDKVE